LLWGYCEALRYIRLLAARALQHQLQRRSARLLLKNDFADSFFDKIKRFSEKSASKTYAPRLCWLKLLSQKHNATKKSKKLLRCLFVFWHQNILFDSGHFV
jgi:hypothetical protein